MMTDEPLSPELPNDLLWGVPAIARHVGLTERQARYKIDCGALPAGKSGGKFVASKRRLAEYFSLVTSGKAA